MGERVVKIASESVTLSKEHGFSIYAFYRDSMNTFNRYYSKYFSGN